MFSKAWSGYCSINEHHGCPGMHLLKKQKIPVCKIAGYNHRGRGLVRTAVRKCSLAKEETGYVQRTATTRFALRGSNQVDQSYYAAGDLSVFRFTAEFNSSDQCVRK